MKKFLVAIIVAGMLSVGFSSTAFARNSELLPFLGALVAVAILAPHGASTTTVIMLPQDRYIAMPAPVYQRRYMPYGVVLTPLGYRRVSNSWEGNIVVWRDRFGRIMTTETWSFHNRYHNRSHHWCRNHCR